MITMGVNPSLALGEIYCSSYVQTSNHRRFCSAPTDNKLHERWLDYKNRFERLWLKKGAYDRVLKLESSSMMSINRWPHIQGGPRKWDGPIQPNPSLSNLVLLTTCWYLEPKLTVNINVTMFSDEVCFAMFGRNVVTTTVRCNRTDGAPSDTARNTINFLHQENFTFIEPDTLPPNRPDLNGVDYAIWET
jgi:hypothetical protein